MYQRASAALVAITAACATSDPPVATDGTCQLPAVSSAAFQRVDAGDFTIAIPPDFTAADVQGIDSQVGTWRTANSDGEITYDLGFYSNDLSADSTTYLVYEACSESIGGHDARIVTGRLREAPEHGGTYVVAGTWRSIYDGAPQAVHLTVWATTQDELRVPDLIAVVRSVEFD